MKAGIMPTFACPGEITPGQFGPTNITSFFLITLYTLTISSAGIPSVMQTITFIPAETASKIASDAKAGGTKIIDVFAFCSFTASSTVL